jgi:hypothetical protein
MNAMFLKSTGLTRCGNIFALLMAGCRLGDQGIDFAVRSVLLDRESSPQGLSVLKAFNETTRFDELTVADRKAMDAPQTTFNAQIQDELSGRAP